MTIDEHEEIIRLATPFLQKQEVVDFLEAEQIARLQSCKEALQEIGEEGVRKRYKMVGALDALEEIVVIATTPIQD